MRKKKAEENKYITLIVNRRHIDVDIDSILYVVVEGKVARFRMFENKIYKTNMPLLEIEEKLKDRFIKIGRSILVSGRVIHSITTKINLINGETLNYTFRKKKYIKDQLSLSRQKIIDSFDTKNIPKTTEEYFEHYKSFDNLPIAFTDIEMVFDDKKNAIDWIFRYGNEALAKIEKLPLKKLINRPFSKVFDNMDEKWLKSYERTVLYHETIEIVDFSPEVDRYIKITCFPTFDGHCGCLLLDVSKMEFMEVSDEAEKALDIYLGTEPKEIWEVG